MDRPRELTVEQDGLMGLLDEPWHDNSFKTGIDVLESKKELVRLIGDSRLLHHNKPRTEVVPSVHTEDLPRLLLPI